MEGLFFREKRVGIPGRPADLPALSAGAGAFPFGRVSPLPRATDRFRMIAGLILPGWGSHANAGLVPEPLPVCNGFPAGLLRPGSTPPPVIGKKGRQVLWEPLLFPGFRIWDGPIAQR